MAPVGVFSHFYLFKTLFKVKVFPYAFFLIEIGLKCGSSALLAGLINHVCYLNKLLIRDRKSHSIYGVTFVTYTRN